MIKLVSLKSKITFFFLALISVYFVINTILTIIYIKNEKRGDLELLLQHALHESFDYVKKNGEQTDLAFLYKIPHMTSVLLKSGARDIEFFFTHTPYKPKDGEIVTYKRLSQNTFFNLKSSDIEIKKHIISTAISTSLQHLAYLIFIGIFGIYFINRLLTPLNHLATQCKNYQDGNEFYLNSPNISSEILQIKNSLNILVARFEEMRKKDKEIFLQATHDLKTPLAIIKARVDSLKDSKDFEQNEANKKFLEAINGDIQRLYLEIKSILYFNIFDFDLCKEFSVKREITQCVEKFEPLLKSRNLSVKINGEDFKLTTKQNLFSKVIIAIFENAVIYSKENSSIEIAIKPREIRVKNTRGSEINLFSTKLGVKILERISKEIDFNFEIKKDNQNYEVVIAFNATNTGI